MDRSQPSLRHDSGRLQRPKTIWSKGDQSASRDDAGSCGTGGRNAGRRAVFNGNYTITSGKHVLGRGGYTGTVRMSIFPTLKNNSFSPRLLEYQIGNSRVTGIGTIIPYGLERRALVAAVSTDKIFAVGRIAEDTTSGVHLDFCTNTKVSGYILLDK